METDYLFSRLSIQEIIIEGLLGVRHMGRGDVEMNNRQGSYLLGIETPSEERQQGNKVV